MFGAAPEPIPDHQSHILLWTHMNRFIAFVATAALVSSFLRTVEHRAADIVLGALN